MNTNTLDQLRTKIIDYAVENGFKILGAVGIVIVGFIAAHWAGKLLMRGLDKKNLEPPVKMLISRIVKLLVFGFALVTALGTAGVNVTTLVAGIGVAGVGIGLAMQGVLSNIVAGLTIIFTKPFRVGEYIELLGVQGQVQTIELFSTSLLHTDMSRVVIPNRKIVGEILHNYHDIRQLDLAVGVAYGSNLGDVIPVLREILAANPRVLKNPAPGIGINALGDNSIVLAVKPWVSLADYGPAQPEIYQAIVERFQAKGISIPFPQREVRLLKEAEGSERE